MCAARWLIRPASESVCLSWDDGRGVRRALSPPNDAPCCVLSAASQWQTCLLVVVLSVCCLLADWPIQRQCLFVLRGFVVTGRRVSACVRACACVRRVSPMRSVPAAFNVGCIFGRHGCASMSSLRSIWTLRPSLGWHAVHHVERRYCVSLVHTLHDMPCGCCRDHLALRWFGGVALLSCVVVRRARAPARRGGGPTHGASGPCYTAKKGVRPAPRPTRALPSTGMPAVQTAPPARAEAMPSRSNAVAWRVGGARRRGSTQL